MSPGSELKGDSEGGISWLTKGPSGLEDLNSNAD